MKISPLYEQSRLRKDWKFCKSVLFDYLKEDFLLGIKALKSHRKRNIMGAQAS